MWRWRLALAGLAPRAGRLQAQWPLPLSRCHRLLLDRGRVTLDLWFGDINVTDQLDATLNQTVDARFLDGFAPAKNPDAGRQTCLTRWRGWHGRRSRWRRFTSAGFVRRDYRKPVLPCKNAGFGQRRVLCG
ncbi:hypothetical protein KCP73_20955 [Salmonella enterica subsp. enterica]|nr:hypothetical protein KCP73_20955 [Salmonella enterica subsp. enterica]